MPGTDYIEKSPRGYNEKDLFREMFNNPLRGDIQPNAGRIQQEGKKSYCDVYYKPDLDSVKFLAVKFMHSARPISVARYWHEYASSFDEEPVNVTLTEAESKRVVYFLSYLSSYLGVISGRPVLMRQAEPRQRTSEFVAHANRLAKAGQIDAALDIVYDKIDKLLTDGELEQVNTVLSDVNLEQVSIDILLGLLTSTLPAKSKLAGRRRFFDAVEAEIKRRDEWEGGLLTGLEG